MTEIKGTYNLSPFDVANWFVCSIDREAGDSITHLKLQKLLYYSQAWTLALQGKALFNDEIQAWAHGPVVPEVFHAYKEYGFDALPSCECENKVPAEAEAVLMEVKRIYGEKSAKYLEELTHTETPWIEARGGIAPEAICTNIISKDSMASFYSDMLKQ